MSGRRSVFVQSELSARRRGLFAAVTVSLGIHGAVLAAAIHLAGAPFVPELPLAIAVEIVSMSPDPGGQAAATSTATAAAQPGAHGSESGGEARPQAAAPESESFDDIDAQYRTADVVEVDDQETMSEAPVSETATEPQQESLRDTHQPDALAIDSDPGTAHVLAAPPRKPKARNGTPAHRPVPRQPAPQAAKAEPSVNAPPASARGLDTPGAGGGALAAASTAALAGYGDGMAGVLRGPRFQPGAPGNPLPKYPERARRRGYEGLVTLAVQVSADGEALSVRVYRSSGHRILDDAAARAVRRWRFLPLNGDMGAAIARVNVPIAFRLTD